MTHYRYNHPTTITLTVMLIIMISHAAPRTLKYFGTSFPCLSKPSRHLRRKYWIEFHFASVRTVFKLCDLICASVYSSENGNNYSAKHRVVAMTVQTNTRKALKTVPKI
jgi:hypothetical protein